MSTNRASNVIKIDASKPKFNASEHNVWKGILTPRQAEVAELAAQCLTSKQIADILVVEEQTVKYHLSAVYERLGFGHSKLHHRVMLARWWWTNVERAKAPLSVVPSDELAA
jgi:DNA-binding NarL/FixJ family response regulator